MKITFSPPDMTELEIEEVASVIRSGWITTGPKTKEFERRIAAFCHTKKAVCLSSQTACAEMALRLLGICSEDEVIVPAYTYTATASVVCHVGAKLVLIDSQRDCLEMDYEALEKAINEKTKVIIPVDLAGIPCDYKRIFEIVERKKSLFRPSNKIQEAIGRVMICADTAHAFGASWHGNMIGSVADFSSFSFHAVKNLSTAEGGALTWKSISGIDDEVLYQQVQLYSLHGQSKDAFAKTQLGAWEYDIAGPWYKCNMTDLMAGIGLAQMKRYDGILKRRKKIIERYDEGLKPSGIQVLSHYTDEWQSSGHLYITRIPKIGLEKRQEIIVKMAEAGITVNVHYKPLPMMTAYKKMGFDIQDYPNAYRQFENEITLPLHTRLTDEEVEYVIANYKKGQLELLKGEWQKLMAGKRKENGMKVEEIIHFLDRKKIKYRFDGNEEAFFDTFSPLNAPREHSITWARYANDVNVHAFNRIKGIILLAEYDAFFENNCFPIIYVDNVHRTYFRILGFFFEQENPDFLEERIENTAIVETDHIGNGVYIGHHSYIGPHVCIGDHVKIHHNVTIQGNVTIGEHTTIESGARIGVCGYGPYWDENKKPVLVPHLGGVRIGSNVYVGANTCIARGCLGDTVLEDYVKVDNLVHIAHNDHICAGAMVVAGATVCGSAIVKNDAWIAPGAVINESLMVGQESILGIGAIAVKNVPSHKVVVGNPAKVLREVRDGEL